MNQPHATQSGANQPRSCPSGQNQPDVTSAHIPATTSAPTPALIAVLLGFFIVMLDTTIVNVALARVGTGLGASVTQLQWVVDAYTLVFAAVSVLCALAPNAPVLIVARALQGVGAAAIVPATLALISRLYAEPATRARVIGLWGGAGGIAAAVGPVLGGFLVSTVGWRAVFWVNVPVVALTCLLTWRAVPATAGGEGQGKATTTSAKEKMDLPGQVLSILTLVALTYAVLAAGERDWGLIPALAALAGVLLLVAFIIAEVVHPNPMLPLTLFTGADFSVAAVVGFALNVSFFGQLFVLALFFQQYLGYEPWLAGLALTPQACSAVVAAPLGGRAAGRFGPFATMLAGLVIGAVGFGSLVFVTAVTPYVVVAGVTFVAGFGMAFAMPAATWVAVRAAGAEYVGVAGAVVNAARQTGSVAGVAVLGALVAGGAGSGASGGAGEFLAGFHAAVAVAAAVFVGAAVLVAARVLVRRR